ncbi:MAG TPA: hypothetical protein VNT79_04025, partial [Phycisphaerae bacterium]|nr:hypothetical protein [Phycisphaerae bacterium]
VLEEPILSLRWIKYDPDHPDSPNVLVPSPKTKIHAFHVETGKHYLIPHSFDTHDRQLNSMRLFQNRIWAKQSSVLQEPKADSYFFFDLKKRTWKPAEENQWNEADDTGKSCVSSDHLPQKIPHWGILKSEGSEGNRRIVLERSNGQEVVLLRQNDLNVVEDIARTGQAIDAIVLLPKPP